MNYGNKDPHFNHCIVLNTCSPMPIENSVVESYSTEREVLLAWQQLVQRENPDIIIGYNIFGFDYNFMFKRAEENNCVEDFLKLSRNKDEICATKDRDTGKYKIEESTLQIASGQHDFQFIKMNGRLQVDLYNFYRREANLISYKLDYVAGNFIGDFIKELEHKSEQTIIKTSNMTGLLVGSYIHFEEIGHSVDYYADGAKFIVTDIDKEKSKFTINGIVNPDLNSKKVRWCLAKDDVTPKDIFRMTNGTADDRSVIAKYCIQDCNLVHYLFNKSDILTGFIEMAKICSVPINFLVMRGQGIKLTSYVAKKCREKRTLMPVIEKGGLDEGYEGAIVLDPKCDLYLDNPVACNDYASLYPSSMISENLSHDSKVWTLEYDLAGNLIEEWGEKDEAGKFIYDNLPNYSYVDVKYDTYVYRRKHPKAAAEKVLNGYKLCRFAQPSDSGESEGIMPAILKELLKARKDTRKLIPQQTDEFMKNVLDQRQLGYKVTANSLYGQCGAKTSTFYEKDIAACTTATGRKLLTYGKRIVEECYGNNICDTTNHGKVKTRAEYIYGDTDSVFYTFNLEDLDGNPIRGKKALEITIELAQQVGEVSAKFLKSPHDFEYEKTFMPFCLLSKKRYVGMLYETDVNKCKRKEMGIVLKRRDNAPIVKDIYGGIIDILMKKQNIQEAIDFLRGSLQNIVEEKFPMEKLIITKSLRSGYKNPQSIAHKVLADRITARDPGNKPGPGDRIPFAYISTNDKKALQGEKIETPTFITENNLKIDYSFYITNQIMKPVQQVFALVLEKIWTMQKKLPKIKQFKRDVEILRKEYVSDSEKFEEKLETMRCKEIKVLLFDEYLRETNNEKAGVQSLTKYFTKK
jgi:DNA polymerase elongation subunit (family B)